MPSKSDLSVCGAQQLGLSVSLFLQATNLNTVEFSPYVGIYLPVKDL